MNTSPDSVKRRNRAKKDSGTQIVGFRMPPSLAHDVKMEASRRGLSLKALFVEMWDQYNRQAKK